MCAVQQRSMKRADDIRDQIVGLMDRTEVPLLSNLGDNDRIKKAIAAGFFYNTANLQKNGSYRTVKNPQSVHIHPSSGMAEVRRPVSLLLTWPDGRASCAVLISGGGLCGVCARCM